MAKTGIGLEVINFRNRFYQSNYRQMLVVSFILLLMILELMAYIYVLLDNQATPRYFPTTPDGQPIVMPALNIRHLSDEEVVKWAKNAMVEIHDYDFVNYVRTLNDARQYFTKRSFDVYMTDFKGTTNFEAVKVKKYVVQAECLDLMPKSIEYINDFGGRFAWRFQLPMKVTYQNSQDPVDPQNYMVTLTIIRMNTLESPSGLAIQQIIEERV